MRRFRVYPKEGSRLFVRVVVYPSTAALRRASRRKGVGAPPAAGLKLTATTTEWMAWRVEPNGRKRRNPCVAEIRLGANEMGTRIITHEAFHATMAWGRRTHFEWKRLGDQDAAWVEEPLAYFHGDLARLIVDRLYALGLYL